MTSRAAIVAVAISTVASIVSRLIGPDVLTFVLSAIAVIPLSAVLGTATEQLAVRAGPRVGGLLNASLGNAAELIIGLLLVYRGELQVVRASITGSILGNLLFVMGAAFFAGGLHHREMAFSPRAASAHVVSMALAVGAVVLPSVYAQTASASEFRLEVVSVIVGLVLLTLYGLSLLFSLVTHADVFRGPEAEEVETAATWSVRRSVATLVAVSVLLAVESDVLVGALDHTVATLHLSRLWVGLILVPIVGNAAEHATAIMVARKGQTDLALDIAVGSSAQIAMLVTPLLILAGMAWGNDLTLVFTNFELAALVVAVLVCALISLDGRTDWLEGSQLIALYLILAVSAFFIGKR